MFNGLVTLPWWGYVLVALALTHVTIAAVTIYLHRCQAHRALDLHPAVAHFFRFWLWLTTGMRTREWAAVHRKHHAFVEQPDDPHSPQQYGIRTVLARGAELYRQEANRKETIEQYGHGTPDDWLERHVYTPHTNWGVGSMLVIDLLLFGPIGLTIWAVQMMWIPVTAAGIINGVGHYWGYRNFETDAPDSSTNIVPWGILIGGEELHNNHHAFATSARFAMRPGEFDIGWVYIRLLSLLGLARVRRLPPRLQTVPGRRIDGDTVRAFVSARLYLMRDYVRGVVLRVYREELRRADRGMRRCLRQAREALLRGDPRRVDERARQALEEALARSERLAVVRQHYQRLQALWSDRRASQEKLIQGLQEWCRQAEQTGIDALQEFADRLRASTLRPLPA